jgi:tetratricopeptide (TPR) repeat protein
LNFVKISLIFSFVAVLATPLLADNSCSDLNGVEETAAYKLDREYGLGRIERLFERGEEKTFLRFSFWIEAVQSQLRAKPLNELPEYLVEKDVRFQLFMLEELGRAYRTFLPEFEFVYAKTRNFENDIGRYQAAIDYVDAAKGLGLDAADIKYLQRSVDRYRQILVENIGKDGWQPDVAGRIPALAEILEIVTDPKVVSKNKKERDELLRFYGEATKAMYETEYDMNLLEDGIHEFRRDIRKLQIIVFAKRGLTRISSDHGQVRSRELIDKTAETELNSSKYLPTFDAYIDTAPVVISKPYLLALIKYTQEFGKLKDMGESREAITSMWIATGRFQNKSEAERHFSLVLKKNGKTEVDVHAEAKRMYEEIKRLKIFEGMYQEVRIGY